VGVASGSGVPGRWVERVIGVVKAYSTRVGGGPMPTEQENAVGLHLRERGREYGTVTGRPRRCGWFDAVALRQSVQINSISGLCLTKLDVLDGLETIRVCVDYETPGGPQGIAGFANEYYAEIRPIYEELPGWSESTLGARRVADLPVNAQRYIARIEETVGASIDIISTGPDRDETIVLRDPFAR